MQGIPTIAQADLPGDEVAPWFGVFMPAATPGPAIHRLRAAMRDAKRQPDVPSRLQAIGAGPIASALGELAPYLAPEFIRWSKLIGERGIRLA